MAHTLTSDACLPAGTSIARKPVRSVILSVPKRRRRKRRIIRHQDATTLTVRARHFGRLTQRLTRDSLRVMSAVRVAPGRSLNRVLTATGLIMTAYFSYHALAGDRGWFALQDLEGRQAALQQELASVREDRLRFERRVDLLDRAHVDADLLEESARGTLGIAEPDDLIIYRR